ncbi:RxLR effector protein [Phytophthora megakarya]|uniref:RxLR effector protein n=1 Tax=Phytophthora megakarya TaxID=4795 RepID=A0A225W406_9STRA|nr:RxLR effector protein [Phytophthora megakarya]
MRLYSVALAVAAVLMANVGRITSVEVTTADYPSIIRSLDRQKDLVTKIKGGASKFTGKFKGVEAASKYDAQVMKTLQLDRIDDTLTSWKLKDITATITQFNQNSKTHKVSVSGILNAQYGDEVLAQGLVAAQRKAIRQKDSILAQHIETLWKNQMTRWHQERNSVGHVYKFLRMSDDGYDMLTSSKFQLLDDYAKLINKDNPEIPLLGGLTAGLRGEKNMVAFLQAAKRRPETMEKATKLETSLFKKWTDENQLPVNVFQWLKLDRRSVDDTFDADNFKIFVKYVDDFNKNNPQKQQSAIGIFKNSYGDDALVKRLMSVSAVDDPLTKAFAEKHLTQQLMDWTTSKKPVKKVLDVVAIKKDDSAALASRKLDVLEQYYKLNGQQKTLIKDLTLQFDNKGDLATVLESVSSATKEATWLQKQQFAGWMANGISTENFMSRVFKTGVTPETDVQKSIAAKFKVFFDSNRRANN